MAIVFKKNIQFRAGAATSTFNDAHSGLWSINGRLSGFAPTGIGGGAGTPGITALGGTLYFTVSLAPASDDETTLTPSWSQAVAGGVVCAVQGVNQISATLVDTLINLTADPFTIYATFINDDQAPVFNVARESAIAASPDNNARLAYYNASTAAWTPSPQVSVRGVYRAIKDLAGRNGGFTTSLLTSTSIQIDPGSITCSNNRVISAATQLFNVTNFPVTGFFRRDLLVVEDPGDETITPVVKLIPNTLSFAAQTSAIAYARPLSPKQVPLASVLLNGTTGTIVEVIDVRPVLDWTTDAVAASKPVTAAQITELAPQPGLVMLETRTGATGWFTGVFTDRSQTALPTQYAVGTVGAPQVKSFVATVAAPYTPTALDFAPAPYIIRSTFSVTSTLNGVTTDVTINPAYAIDFDFMNGVFMPNGITLQTVGETITVSYRQVSVLFTIGLDGTVTNPDHTVLVSHIAATNNAAHTSANIKHNLNTGGLPGLPGPTATVEQCFAAVSTALGGSSGGGGVIKPSRSIVSWGAGRRTQVIAQAEYPLAFGWNAATPYEPPAATLKAKVRPGHVMIRPATLTGLAFTMDHESSSASGATATVPQKVSVVVYLNGAATPALSTSPVTLAVTSDGGASANAIATPAPVTVNPGDVITASLILNDASSPTITAGVYWLGVNVDLEITYS